MLAHGQNDNAAAGFRVGGIRQEQLGVIGGSPQQEAQCLRNGGIRKLRQFAGDEHDVPHIAKIGERDEQCNLLLGAAQRLHRLRLRPRSIAGPLQIRENAIERGFRRLLQQARQPDGSRTRQMPEEWRMICNAEQKIADSGNSETG